MSILSKAPKLGPVGDKLIRSLLCPATSAGQLLFVQEGVTLKGSTSHDAQTFFGTVFVASDATGAIYVLWLPYSYVYHIDPVLVSPATKQSLALDKIAPAKRQQSGQEDDEQGTGNSHSNISIMRAEWLFSQCVPFEQVSRIKCKATLRGKRVITLLRGVPAHTSSSVVPTDGAATGADFPLTFHDGGVNKLLSVLGSFATVQPAPGGSQDDLIVTHNAQPALVASTASNAAATPNGKDPMQQYREQTYGDADGVKPGEKKKVGARVWGNIVGLVSRGGKFLAEHFLDDDDDNNNARQQQQQSQQQQGRGGVGNYKDGNGDDSEFDMMNPLEPIEEVKPKLRLPSKMPPRGAPLSPQQWSECFVGSSNNNSNSKLVLDIDKFNAAREVAFNGGIDDSIRGEVWKFLLGVYPLNSSAASRRALDEENANIYEAVMRQWTSIGPEQEKHFAAFRERRTAVDKDVARTDRSHAAFQADHSERLAAMRRILMTYSFFNFDAGYCQGMSDILAVLLLLYPDSDAEAFTVFRFLMNKVEGNFMNGDKHTMASQLRAVEVLTHAFIPPLYSHLQQQGATNMCFCFRWLLVLFKREYGVDDIKRLWDVIFACPFSDRYEIVMAVTLLRAASEQIIDHAMQFDELLKYSNSLCTAITATELLQASAEMYDFMASQYEWSKKSAAGSGGMPASAGSSSSMASAALVLPGGSSPVPAASPVDQVKNRKTGDARPSVRDLVEVFQQTVEN